MSELLGFALLAGPFMVSLSFAFFLGRFLSNRFNAIPAAAKIIIAGIAGVIAPVGYLWVWQTIDVAMREARGDTSEYMGPMVWLVYGFPFFIISSILCFVLATFAVKRSK